MKEEQNAIQVNQVRDKKKGIKTKMYSSMVTKILLLSTQINENNTVYWREHLRQIENALENHEHVISLSKQQLGALMTKKYEV